MTLKKSKRRVDLSKLPPDQAISVMKQVSKTMGEKFQSVHDELSKIVNTYGFDLHFVPEIAPNDKVEFMVAFVLTKEGVTFAEIDDLVPGNVKPEPVKKSKWNRLNPFSK